MPRRPSARALNFSATTASMPVPAMLKNRRPSDSPPSIVRLRPWSECSTARPGSDGSPSSFAKPFPDPAGMIPSGVRDPASVDATSLIVPSPPQAMTSDAPRSSAARASSRACPPRSVRWTPPATPAAVKRRSRNATRRPATSGVAPAPDNGLTIATIPASAIRGRDVIVSAAMGRPWVRIVVVLAGLVAIAAAAVLTWSAEFHARSTDAALRQAEDAGRRALVDASELRAAQQAYVAEGQGEDFWFARVAALGKDLDEVVAIFKGHPASPEALADADEAIAALQDFHQVDARARDLSHSRQLAQASDVIFGDGFDVTQKLTAAIARALTAERVARDAADG